MYTCHLCEEGKRALCVMGMTRVISAKYMVFAACACVTGELMYVLRVLCCVNCRLPRAEQILRSASGIDKCHQ